MRIHHDDGSLTVHGSEAGEPPGGADAALRTALGESRMALLTATIRQSDFYAIEVGPGYVALARGGFLDNVFGLLYVNAGREPPPLGSGLLGSRLVHLRPMGGLWYEFGTT